MDDAKARIREFFSRFFRAPDLRDGDDIFAMGFVNSLFAMQLVMWVEQEFNLKVENEDLELSNFNSVNALATFVACKHGEVPETVGAGSFSSVSPG